MRNPECVCSDPACRGECLYECSRCGDGDALRDGEACAYCGTEREYRQDDQTVGYCPKCGKQLANLTTGLRGYCEQHGWTFADWEPRRGLSDMRRQLGRVPTAQEWADERR